MTGYQQRIVPQRRPNFGTIPQTHALLMEILARGVLFASSEATNASEDACDAELLNSESKRLWLVVMNKIDRVFQCNFINLRPVIRAHFF